MEAQTKFAFFYVACSQHTQRSSLGESVPLLLSQWSPQRQIEGMRAPGRPALKHLPVSVDRRLPKKNDHPWSVGYTFWVYVDKSKALAHLPGENLGVFAARVFEKDTRLGRYTGRVVARPEDAASVPPGNDDYQLTIDSCILRGDLQPQTVAEQMALLGLQNPADVPFLDREWLAYGFAGDPDHVWPDMYPHLMNDPRDLGEEFEANVAIDRQGFVYTLRSIARDEELLYDYGDKYWDGSERGKGDRAGAGAAGN